MKKAVVRKHAQVSAAHKVVAHALWAAGRGRKPSLPYGEVRNPRLAVSAALVELGSWLPKDHLPVIELLQRKLGWEYILPAAKQLWPEHFS